MGIKGLAPFIKEKAPNAFRDVPYSYFRGKRVAVDSDNVLRKLMARAYKQIVNRTDVCTQEVDRKQVRDLWLHHVKEEISKFLKFGITLLFVFDGSYIDEKSATQTKRKDAKKKMIKEAEDMKKKVLEVDELERTPQMVTELRKKMHHLGNILPEEKDLICEVLRQLGFPVLFATEEGEKLCAMLCIEGYVDAVYSRDTDVVAMGCPISFGEEAGWISVNGKSEMAVKCCFFSEILPGLNMSYETFLDLCIMCGCDFNSNIRLIGVVKAYKLLIECKSIDHLPAKFNETKLILNHVRCREIFGRQKASDICQIEIVNNLDLSALEKVDIVFFEKWDISDWIADLKILYKMFTVPSDVRIEKPYVRTVLRILKRGELDGVVQNTEVSKDAEKGEVKNVEKETKTDDLKDIASKVIPKQIPSPKRLNAKIITNLNNQQLERFKQRELEKEKPKLKLKILSSNV